MKKFRLSSIGVSAAALLLLAGCDEGMYEGSGTGTISPAVTYDSTIAGARAVSSRAEFDDLTVNDLTLLLTKADGSFSAEFAYGDFPKDQQFSVGKYTLTASYGNPAEEGFEAPAVYGSAELSVSEGKATQVELTAKPSKAMVGVKFAEDLLDYMTEVSAEVRTAANTIAYSTSETRYVYTQAGHVAVDVTFTKPNGKAGTLEAISFEAEAQHRYNITLSLGGDGAGSVEGISVTYDDAVEEQTVDLDISDEVLTVPAPEITLTGADNGQVFSIIEGSPLGASPKMKISAKGGIKSAMLVTTGDITSKGWPAQVDLASASASQLASLEAMGLKGVTTFRNGSKLAMVDFTAVAKHVDATADGEEPTMFSLIITDANGKTSEPASFGVKVDRLAISLRAIDGVKYSGGGQVDVEMEYNGTAPIEELVTVKYRNENGVWSTASIESAQVVSRTMSTYRVTVSIPDNAKLPLTLKASAGSSETGEITIPEGPYVAVAENDIFATHLWASVSYDGAPVADGATFEVSTDGVNFSKATGSPDGSDYHITGGLTPATTYYLRAKVGGNLTNKLKITTESPTQLPNAKLDESSIDGQGSNWENYSFGSAWGTNNPMTTSQGSDYGYVRISGTKPTDDSHSGKAVCISTQGWGSGTTAATWNFSVLKYVDAGLLHLGASRSARPSGYGNRAGCLNTDDLEQGYEFASRPSALKFWTKYSAKNSSDTGIATALVYDAAGNIIAQGSLEITSADASYSQKTIPFSYKRGTAKAARIYVCFMSTTKTQALEKDKNWITNPPFGNLGRGEWYGSRMFIDDIELVYE
ncbi:MAG: DUF4493 domain-containing protein [Muribaculaceae bacterium]|nr:DUF4493 domain-containing protein [Muribaculaceae bacterium]